MSDDIVPFRTILASAEDRLQWSVEPAELEDAARAVLSRLPGSLVADQLMGRAADLRTALSRFPSHDGPGRAAPPPGPARAARDGPTSEV